MSVVTAAPNVEPHAPANSARRAARVVRWSLGLFGTVDLLATAAVVMPGEWMRAVHALCGLGEFPDGPLPLYLARSTSMLYAFHGAILWCLSTDVRRYQPVIRFLAAGTILCGLILIPIDLAAGIPSWWTWTEGPSFAVSGAWLLAWTSRMNSLDRSHGA